MIHDIQIFDLGIQTRRILGIHCDSGDLTHFTHICVESFVLLYLSSKDLMGFRGRACKQM